MAAEVLVGTLAVRNILRAATDQQLRTAIQSGRKAGMQTMMTSLDHLLEEKVITEAVYENVAKSYRLG